MLDVWGDPKFVSSYREMEDGLLGKIRLYEKVLSFVPLPNEGNMFVLDLGSGLSTIKLPIEGMGYNYIGMDLSKGMLNEAASREGNNNLLQVNVLDGGLPIASSSVSIVLATNFLYNFTQEQLKRDILPQIRRVLKPGGQIIITNPIPNANNNKIIKEEWNLRGGRLTDLLTLVGDLIRNREFLIQQKSLSEGALKRTSDEWIEDLTALGFNTFSTDSAYAGQAFVLCAKLDS